MPINITLFHFTELSIEAKAKALEFWKPRHEFKFSIYEGIAAEICKNANKLIRRRLKDSKLPFEHMNSSYSADSHNIVNLNDITIKGDLDINELAFIIGENYHNLYLKYKELVNVHFKINLKLIKDTGGYWWRCQRNDKFESKVVDKTKWGDIEDSALYSTMVTEKLQSYINSVLSAILLEATDHITSLVKDVLKANIEQEKENHVITKVISSNLNYTEDGTPFIDQYYNEEFHKHRDYDC